MKKSIKKQRNKSSVFDNINIRANPEIHFKSNKKNGGLSCAQRVEKGVLGENQAVRLG